MIEITATGDTTLHTAGKYCAEDILVKVPSGSGASGASGGAAIETCTFTYESEYESYKPTMIAYTTLNGNGDVVYESESCSGSSVTISCLCNSVVAIKCAENISTAGTARKCELLLCASPMLTIGIQAESDGTASYTCGSDTTGGSN